MRRLAAIFSLLLAVPASPLRAEAPAMSQLLENIQYWRQRGRADKVAESWRKVLASDPTNQQALVELATYEAEKGHKNEAERYLARLEKLAPKHPEIPRIRRLIDMGDKYETLLAQARSLARARKIDEAVAKYREVFGKQAPSGALGLEYYTTLGGSEGGWEEARAGLERLAKANPDDPYYAFVYARHLTYREATRREGIARLRQLAGTPRVQREARAAWKDALLWLGARPGDAGLYSAYLAEAGEDAAIRAKQQALVRTKHEVDTLAPARQALREGELGKAEELFRGEAGERPSPEALVGLADVAMQKKQYDEAVRLLREVQALAPGRPALWKHFLRSAEFWQAMAQAEALRAAGKLREAEALAIKAARLSPDDAVHADLLLGHIYLAQGKRAEAQKRFEAVLRRSPDSIEALRAMIEIHIAARRLTEASALSAKLARLEAAAGARAAKEKGRAQAEALRVQAAIDRTTGALEKAQALLEDARRSDPENQWVLLDLIQVHLMRRQVGEARDALATLQALQAAPSIETRLAEVRVLAEEGRIFEAYERVCAIPTDDSNADVIVLKSKLKAETTVATAMRRYHAGRVDEARRILDGLQREVGEDDDFLATLALAWGDINEPERALKILRRLVERDRGHRTTRQLQLAAVLLRTQRYDELARLLENMSRQGTFSPEETRDFAALRLALAIHEADRVRLEGNLRRSFELLRPLAEDHPDDPRVLIALARLFVDLDDPEGAYQAFQRVLAKEPSNFEAREGAMLAALRLNRETEAKRLVELGYRLAPKTPQAELAAARYYAAIGDDVRAMAALRRAWALLDKTPGGLPTPKALLMLEARPEQRWQERGDLLDMAAAKFEDRLGPAEVGPPPSLEQQIQTEMAEIEARHAGDLVVQPMVRFRDGVAGLGQLTQVTGWLSVSAPTGLAGRLRFTFSPMVLYSGSLAMLDPTVGDRFGRIGTVTLDPTTKDITQSAAGVGIDLSWAYHGWTLFVGTTPLGFPLWTMTGGASWRASFGGFGIGVSGGRRSVTDSLLSYSGATDPVSGRTWGMVTANGGRLDVGYRHGAQLYYAYGGFEWLLGQHVQQNRRGLAGAGLRWRLHEWSGLALHTGLSFGFMSYARNLRFFTWGQGGYFSPQLFFNGGVPIIFEGRRGKFEVHMEGELGLNWFREHGVPYYPSDAGLQAMRETRLDPITNEPLESIVPGKTSISMMVNLRARLAYRFTSQLVLGLDLAFHTAADYQEFIGGIFLGWGFKPGSVPRTPVLPPL